MEVLGDITSKMGTVDSFSSYTHTLHHSAGLHAQKTHTKYICIQMYTYVYVYSLKMTLVCTTLVSKWDISSSLEATGVHPDNRLSPESDQYPEFFDNHVPARPHNLILR